MCNEQKHLPRQHNCFRNGWEAEPIQLCDVCICFEIMGKKESKQIGWWDGEAKLLLSDVPPHFYNSNIALFGHIEILQTPTG